MMRKYNEIKSDSKNRFEKKVYKNKKLIKDIVQLKAKISEVEDNNIEK